MLETILTGQDILGQLVHLEQVQALLLTELGTYSQRLLLQIPGGLLQT